MLRGRKFRLYPSPEQKYFLAQQFGHCRFVFNHFLNIRRKAYQETGKSPTYNKCAAMLTVLKKEKPWLKDVNSQSLQQSLRHLDLAYQRFFKKLCKYPKKKNKHNGHQSFSVPQAFGIEQHLIFIPKMKIGIPVVFHRKLGGKPKSLTISKTPTGKYYVNVLCDIPEPVQQPVPESFAGVDVGLKTLAVTSNGFVATSGKYFRMNQMKLARFQRALSRKVKGSKNRIKSKLRVALLHEYIANQRKDQLHKVSRRIVDESQAIVLEDLNVAGMLRNHCLALSLSDAGLGELHRQIQYKAEGAGKLCLQVGRFYPSSKTCSDCGEINKALKLSDRSWVCTACGSTHDRDYNAAKNLEKQGIAGHAKSCGSNPAQSLPSPRKRRGTGRVERNSLARDSVMLAGSLKQEIIQIVANNG